MMIQFWIILLNQKEKKKKSEKNVLRDKPKKIRR
jgi:hypothetical protein